MEQAAIWTGLLVFIVLTGAIVAMVNIATQPAHCRWCEHCRQQEQAKRDRDLTERHTAFHRYDRTPVDCTDPNCPGRR